MKHPYEHQRHAPLRQIPDHNAPQIVLNGATREKNSATHEKNSATHEKNSATHEKNSVAHARSFPSHKKKTNLFVCLAGFCVATGGTIVEECVVTGIQIVVECVVTGIQIVVECVVTGIQIVVECVVTEASIDVGRVVMGTQIVVECVATGIQIVVGCVAMEASIVMGRVVTKESIDVGRVVMGSIDVECAATMESIDVGCAAMMGSSSEGGAVKGTQSGAVCVGWRPMDERFRTWSGEGAAMWMETGAMWTEIRENRMEISERSTCANVEEFVRKKSRGNVPPKGEAEGPVCPKNRGGHKPNDVPLLLTDLSGEGDRPDVTKGPNIGLRLLTMGRLRLRDRARRPYRVVQKEHHHSKHRAQTKREIAIKGIDLDRKTGVIKDE